MTDSIIEILKNINIGELIAIGVMGWVLYNRLNKKMDKLDERLSNEIRHVNTTLSNEIKMLSHKVEDIDRRLCRIEGSLATQGHCLFHQSPSEKKAE